MCGIEKRSCVRLGGEESGLVRRMGDGPGARALWLETASMIISASAARIVRYMVPEAEDCRKSGNAFMFKVFQCPPAFQSIFAMAFISHDK